MSWSVELFDRLEPVGLASDTLLAHAIAERFEAQPVCKLAEVTRADTPEETLEALGVSLTDADWWVTREARSKVMELTRPSGLVSHCLTNGHLLCTASATRKVTEAGEKKIRNVTVRFVSSEPAITKAFYLDPDVARAESMLRRLAARQERAVRKQPGLQAYLDGLRKRLRETARQELPSGDEEE